VGTRGPAEVAGLFSGGKAQATAWENVSRSAGYAGPYPAEYPTAVL
jgi:hypothetical protein